MAVQITESQLFEMLGRVFAEARAIGQENERLRTLVTQLQQQPEETRSAPPDHEDDERSPDDPSQ